ncbi:hypothetical protein ETAA8_07780 [Anatilimnocola aggregata]|uniref:Uncharacterized protein n=1 Tax=Anatilimnocola aggregata TaxID=2528021 RepID=A0A517Y648_9BACT|nr:hypothetical protein [Anatilimnocola aggregata]QDU25708.1 hypothetical protein ETAA8_07780 [Anatilimnocola aggregata]
MKTTAQLDSHWFFRPSLGWTLTLTNINAWVILFLIVRGHITPGDPFPASEFLLVLLGLMMLILSIPFATCVMLPSGHGGMDYLGIVFTVVVIGANSFAWGYGLAWCIKTGCRFIGISEEERQRFESG